MLDLFAGSGALGLEALSRGAATALFIEADRRVYRQLTDTIAELGADTGRALCADAYAYLATPAREGHKPRLQSRERGRAPHSDRMS